MSYHLAAGDPVTPPSTGPGPGSAFRNVVGQSGALRAALEMAVRVSARRGSTVLVEGETGTGKELFARGIHAAGPNPEAPFVPVSCSAIPAQLLEPELFGQERGSVPDARGPKAGLLEVARQGTLFLDEVGELPNHLQPKLLRVLEEQRVRRVGGYGEIHIRCRIIAATNGRLEEAVSAGRFREDLFYRLNVLRLTVPPLRAREGDIRLLARHFLNELAEEQGLPPAELTEEAMMALEAHEWPGNVRELKNVLDRAALLSDGGMIDVDRLGLEEQRPLPSSLGGGRKGFIAIPPGGRSLASVEAEAVRLTLELTGWNQSEAARMLKVSRPTIARKIRRYRLTPDAADAADGRGPAPTAAP